LNLSELHRIFLNSTGVCTDTRKIEHGSLFIALKGETFDGNQFALQAMESGAIAAVVDHPASHDTDNGTILVEDTLETLQALAHYHRDYLGIPIISLTGSNGKTTTKELIHSVLSKKYKCIATKGNLNNHIGVPLTLLSMDDSTEMGIVEMGANHIGEIATLCEIATPNYGYITNFGKAHLEGFGSEEGVVQGKSELYQFIDRTGGLLFVNGNDHRQMQITENMNRYIFNGDDKEFTLLDSDGLLKFSWAEHNVQTKLVGEYNLSNAAAAIAIGEYFEVDAIDIIDAIENYDPKMNRSEIRDLKGHRIIMDAYNANPTSMAAAISNFEKMKAKRKLLVLGDMFELGKDAAMEHEAIVTLLAHKQDMDVILIGKNFFSTKGHADHIIKVSEIGEVREALTKKLATPLLVLIKGSRGMALERCLDFF